MKTLVVLCRYDPSKYAGRDDDDSDMEADFATIEMEEQRRYTPLLLSNTIPSFHLEHYNLLNYGK